MHGKYWLQIVAIVLCSIVFGLCTIASAQAVRPQNADDAEALTKKFSTFTPDQKCTPDEIACIGDAFSKCATVAEGRDTVDKFQLQPCNAGLKCVVVPLVNKRGTSITCSTEEDQLGRLDQARNDL
jgi:hypothetical protein